MPSYLISEINQHRFYKELWMIVMHVAQHVCVFGHSEQLPEGYEAVPRLRSAIVGYDLKFGVTEVNKRAAAGYAPGRMRFDLIEKPVQPPPTEEPIATDHIALALFIHRAIFAVGVERYITWYRSTINNNPDTWNDVIKFCWIIRNAIAHNSKISINNMNLIPAIWRGREYGPNQNGQSIVTSFLPADLVFLMFDFNDELTKIGAPKFI